MNETMEEVDEETRLRARREMQRNNLKLKREQLKYQKIILESTQRQFFEAQKISFWTVIRIAGNGEVVLSNVLPFVK